MAKSTAPPKEPTTKAEPVSTKEVPATKLEPADDTDAPIEAEADAGSDVVAQDETRPEDEEESDDDGRRAPASHVEPPQPAPQASRTDHGSDVQAAIEAARIAANAVDSSATFAPTSRMGAATPATSGLATHGGNHMMGHHHGGMGPQPYHDPSLPATDPPLENRPGESWPPNFSPSQGLPSVNGEIVRPEPIVGGQDYKQSSHPFKVFCGGIPQLANERVLFDVFEREVGTVMHVQLVLTPANPQVMSPYGPMMQQTPRYHRGYAFVTFKSAELRARALSRRQYKLFDRVMEVKEIESGIRPKSMGPSPHMGGSSPYSPSIGAGVPSASSHASTDPENVPPDCKLFVALKQQRELAAGLLPGDMQLDENNMREHFEHYGKIKKVVVVKDKQTQACKGYGFIYYCEPTGPQAALMVGREHLLGGRIQVECKRFSPNYNSPSTHQMSPGAMNQMNPNAGMGMMPYAHYGANPQAAAAMMNMAARGGPMQSVQLAQLQQMAAAGMQMQGQAAYGGRAGGMAAYGAHPGYPPQAHGGQQGSAHPYSNYPGVMTQMGGVPGGAQQGGAAAPVQGHPGQGMGIYGHPNAPQGGDGRRGGSQGRMMREL